jgi:hypothetical protein
MEVSHAPVSFVGTTGGKGSSITSIDSGLGGAGTPAAKWRVDALTTA